ncbi:MAG: TonB-dependent receptor plug domain-containing protein, partial [Planctomycetes bacterium]|nr:TonB-dependent receptor plug domain-containing protein [Planctomycetota bacterium]
MTWIAMLLACSFEPACAGPPAPQAPQEQEPTPDKKSRLTDLTIEDLMRIEVTSAARKPERLVDTASAIFVIRNDDILRSGVRSVPEALRMAPGIEVARIDANKWSVTARGSGGMFANKLLVLVDGRSVYNPTFSGVHWDVQDLMLEDVDRIEVIRGPGATVWGANAVNGVINIITKKASETQGGVATGGGGTQERGFGAARLGGKIGDRTYYRVFAKYFDRADSEGGNDLSKLGHTGMRLDWNPEDSDTLTLQGDYYRGTMGVDRFAAMLLPPFQEEQFTSSRVSGGNLLARWTHEAGPKNVLAAQFYYDRTDRNAPWNRETRDTLDFDLHHAIPLLEGHDVTWGLGLRWTRGEFGNTFTSQVIPDTKVDQISSAFLQDEISLVPGALLLTLGSKFEYNNYTRLEILPNARLLCTLAEDQVVWLAASRAVRTPAPADTRARFNQAVMPPPGPG